MRVLRAALAALLICSPAAAQQSPQTEFSLGQVQSVVLTIDTDRLFADSLFGQRIATELIAERQALEAENARIAAALTAEERSLTERRPTMEVEAFRAAAAEFDDRVQAIRAAQDARGSAIEEAARRNRDVYLNAAAPILADIMRQAGASVILDRRTVFLALGTVDITEEAIEAIDAAIGDGADLLAPEAPDDAPVPGETPAP